MSGCDKSGLQEAVAPAADLTALRCPPVRSADARALRQVPVTPPAGAVTDAAAKAWIDGLEGQVRDMNKAGSRVLWLYGRCRDDIRAQG